MYYFPKRITLVWLFLMLLTCLSFEVVQGFGFFSGLRMATSAAIVIAFLKVRFILLDFMELKRAPLPARLFVEAWCVGTCLVLLGEYLIGSPGPSMP